MDVHRIDLPRGSTAAADVDHRLVADVVDLARSYYANPVEVVESSFVRNNGIYLGRDPDGSLASCFFVRWWPTLPPEFPARRGCYAGLALTRDGRRSVGRFREMIRVWIADVEAMRARAAPLLVWGMTGLPFVYRVAAEMLEGLEPATTEPSLAACRLARDIARAFHTAEDDAATVPFVLRRVSKARYLESFLRSIDSDFDEILPSSRFDLRAGDRLLLHVIV